MSPERFVKGESERTTYVSGRSKNDGLTAIGFLYTD
jgi:hypothetical protein